MLLQSYYTSDRHAPRASLHSCLYLILVQGWDSLVMHCLHVTCDIGTLDTMALVMSRSSRMGSLITSIYPHFSHFHVPTGLHLWLSENTFHQAMSGPWCVIFMLTTAEVSSSTGVVLLYRAMADRKSVV